MQPVRVRPEAIRPLRRAVLRPGEPVESLALHGDDDPLAAHFAILDADRVVACASVMCEGAPSRSEGHGRGPRDASSAPGEWRVRSVATDPASRRRGHGRRLVMACVEHARANDGVRAWLQTTPDGALAPRASPCASVPTP